MTPRLAALATAVPPYVLDQDDVVGRRARAVRRLRPISSGCCRSLPIAASSAAIRRCRSTGSTRRIAGRTATALYLAGALDLIETVAGRALDHAGIEPRRNRRRRHRLDHRDRDAEPRRAADRADAAAARRPAAADLRARLRRRRARARPGRGAGGGDARKARCCSSSSSCARCSSAATTMRNSNIVAHRAVRRRRRRRGAALRAARGPAIVASGEHTWPNSLDIMGWDVAEDGLQGNLLARHPAPRRGRARRRSRAISWRGTALSHRRYRPLRLPSRRTEGDRRLRERVRPERPARWPTRGDVAAAITATCRPRA